MPWFLTPKRRWRALVCLTVATAWGDAEALTSNVDGFVQAVGNNQGYPPSSRTLSVTLPAPPKAGDLILVSVGWGDSTSTISAVADSNGHAYQSAVGPTDWSSSRQYREQIFYGFSDGDAGVIEVKVGAIPTIFFELRVYEYAGINPIEPIDGTATATGTSDSLEGTVTTVRSGDLLFALGQQNGLDTLFDAGASFVRRDVLDGGGMLAEDKIASAPGEYPATFSLSTPHDWSLQILALKRVASTAGRDGGTGVDGGSNQDAGTDAGEPSPNRPLDLGVGCDCQSLHGISLIWPLLLSASILRRRRRSRLGV